MAKMKSCDVRQRLLSRPHPHAIESRAALAY